MPTRRAFLASLGAALAACWVPREWMPKRARVPPPLMPPGTPNPRLVGPTWEGAFYDEKPMTSEQFDTLTDDVAAVDGHGVWCRFDTRRAGGPTAYATSPDGPWHPLT